MAPEAPEPSGAPGAFLRSGLAVSRGDDSRSRENDKPGLSTRLPIPATSFAAPLRNFVVDPSTTG
jgi:hypothetical protein